ncbi:MAG: L-seryl-tRNA(Sec) selenium transferase [Chloroflexi bacterium]|nr:L-seryl-tRNA(Sec) selenium transferase [Chloroflexota bacterium]
MTQLRNIPSVERVVSSDLLAREVRAYSRDWIVSLVRLQLDKAREIVREGAEAPSADEVAEAIRQLLESMNRPAPVPVINATGVVIHTNLGRAPLSRSASEAAILAAQGYSNLEFDLSNGRRGSRQAHLQDLLQQLTGAEAGLVVNNNASAVLLGLSALAAGKEVVVSRGEAVEIGGGFRVPDVLSQSGAILVDVGTTNRTYARDYENAITDRTGAFLKAHASNFRVEGFTAAVEPAELVQLGADSGIPVLHDVGSGALLATEAYGLAHEPTPQESVASGVGLTFFSGDKLLGGPQAGIVVGSRELVEMLERHPLARAFRIDKMSLASLIATLMHYLRGEAEREVPIWRMISAPVQILEERAESWKKAITSGSSVIGAVVETRSAIGGGSLPGETLPTRALSLDCSSIGRGAEGVMQRLRRSNPPVIARIEDNQVLLDPRTVLPEQEGPFLKSLQGAISSP